MKNVWISALLGLTLLAAGSVWGSGGQRRLGQDAPRQHQLRSQPTTSETYQNSCPQRNPLCPNLGTSQQDRLRLHDGSGNGSCPGTEIGPQSRKQIRDRKRDGSCVIAAGQTRTRGGSGTGTGTRTRDRSC